MEPSISDYEVSIIKGMLRMGYRPTLIQSYFTRPDRLVNPARIQEMRTNEIPRIAKISEASDEDVGNFLDSFARENPKLGMYAPPQQEPEVTKFQLSPEGRITILSSEQDLQLGNPEIREIYDELRLKAVEFSALGHNSLGAIHQDVRRFAELLPENPLEASIVRVFMRGSSLKSKLTSYHAYKENPDLYPLVDIDDTVYPLFDDLINSFSLLVNLTPSMAALESKATSRKQYDEQAVALEAIKPALEDVEEVAEQAAAEILDEQVDDGLKAADDPAGRAQRAVAFSSVRNFAISIFTPVYHAARYVLGDGKLPTIIQAARNGIAYSAGQKLYPYIHDRFPAVVGFIKNHAETLGSYAEKIITNPQLKEFVDVIIEFLKHIP